MLHIGTGKGGTSIWGKKFEDEFHESLRVYSCFSSNISNYMFICINKNYNDYNDII